MKHSLRHAWRHCLPPLALFIGTSSIVVAQQPASEEGPNSSLYSAKLAMQTAQRLQAPLGQSDSPAGNSWYETPLPPPKEVKRGDLIKIRVDLGSRVIADGEMQRRKNSQYDALLNDWVLLNGLRSVKPDPQPDGDQRIRGTQSQLYRAIGEMQTSESMKFNITATVSDILPNGNIVLEAHWKINNNNEQWIRSLSGIVARENIGPGNLVLGEDVADLHIGKQETGHVRDSYRRGWVTRLLDVFSPF